MEVLAPAGEYLLWRPWSADRGAGTALRGAGRLVEPRAVPAGTGPLYVPARSGSATIGGLDRLAHGRLAHGGARLLLFIFPGLLGCGLLAGAYVAWGDLALVKGALLGARAAIIGIVLVAATRLLMTAATDVPRRWTAGLALVGLLAGVPFLLLALLAGLYGWYVRPADEAEIPPISDRLKVATRLAGLRLLPIVGLFFLLWACFGHAHGVVRLAEVSLLAVMLSFGGAYAALGYWRLRADAHGWLSDAKFGNALIVGEATPGPLLLAGSFVGAVAGWHGQLGVAPGWLGGVVGLLLPALFTFVPSTVLVLSLPRWRRRGLAIVNCMMPLGWSPPSPPEGCFRSGWAWRCGWTTLCWECRWPSWPVGLPLVESSVPQP